MELGLLGAPEGEAGGEEESEGEGAGSGEGADPIQRALSQRERSAKRAKIEVLASAGVEGPDTGEGLDN